MLYELMTNPKEFLLPLLFERFARMLADQPPVAQDVRRRPKCEEP